MSVGSFFSSLGSKLKSLFTKAPAIEVQVSSAVNFLAPFVEAAVVVADPEAAVIIDPIIDRVKVGLAALAVTIKQSQTPAGTVNVNSILASLASNATALEQVAGIKNEDEQKKIAALAQMLSDEVAAIQAALKPPVA